MRVEQKIFSNDAIIWEKVQRVFTVGCQDSYQKDTFFLAKLKLDEARDQNETQL